MIRNEAGEETDHPTPGERITVHTMVNYAGDRAMEISLMAAQYAADGSSTGVDFTAAPIGAGMQKEYALEDVEIRQDTVRIAVFLWEQQSMRPIPLIA